MKRFALCVMALLISMFISPTTEAQKMVLDDSFVIDAQTEEIIPERNESVDGGIPESEKEIVEKEWLRIQDYLLKNHN